MVSWFLSIGPELLTRDANADSTEEVCRVVQKHRKIVVPDAGKHLDKASDQTNNGDRPEQLCHKSS
jgi:hypothetical protein